MSLFYDVVLYLGHVLLDLEKIFKIFNPPPAGGRSKIFKIQIQILNLNFFNDESSCFTNVFVLGHVLLMSFI